jgi:hypothetical protein
MRWIMASVLVVLWVLGVSTAHTWAGLIHILLVLAAALLAEQLIRARPGRPLRQTGSHGGALK